MSNANQNKIITAVAAAGVVSAVAYYLYKNHQKKANKKEDEAPKPEPVAQEPVEEKKPEIINEAPKEAEAVEEKKIQEESPKPEVKEEPKKEEEKVESPKPVEPKKPSGYVEFYNTAKKMFTNQDYENALINFNNAIDASPKNNPQMKTLKYSRASCLKKLNRLEESAADYTECITLDPKYSRAYKARAGVYRAMNRDEDAMEDFSMCYLLDMVKAGDMQPTPEGMEECIQSLAQKQAKEEQERRHNDPNYKAHLPSKQFISFYFSMLTSESSDVYNTLKLTEAELTAKIDSYNPEQGVSLGDLYLMRGGQRKANESYEAAYEDFKVAADPTNGCTNMDAALLEKATFLSLSGDVLSALPIYESLYNANPEHNNVNLVIKYAACLLEAGDERYHAIFDEAVRCNPNACDVYFHRGQMLYIENDVTKALADLVKVTQLDSNHVMSYVQQAFCHMNVGDAQRAVDCMNRAVACGKQKAQVQNHFGEMYIAFGKLAEAESCFKEGLKYNNRWAYIYVNQAVLALQMRQDYLNASKLLEKAIKLDKSCITAYTQLAQMHMMLQEWDEAKRLLNEAFDAAISESDLKQVCALKVTMDHQMRAIDKYQAILKAETTH